MTILKARNGKEINTDDFKYYGFGKYVRENIDENWGLGKSLEQNKTKMYKVTLTASVSASAYCFKTVEAENEQEAGQIAQEEISRFEWDIDNIDDVDDVTVSDVEEINTDE